MQLVTFSTAAWNFDLKSALQINDCSSPRLENIHCCMKAGCFEFCVCHPIGYAHFVTDEHEMRWKTWIKWKQDNSETQNVNWIIKNITYGDVSNINIVQNYEFEDEKTETQQPQIHLYLSVIIGATMSVMCSQTVTVLFFYVFFTRKWGSLKSHIALTLISPQAFIFTDSWLPRESRNDTYFSDLVHACVWMRACVCENLHIWMCAYTGSVCVGPRDRGGTCNRVWLSAAANWIGDVRKTMTQLPRGLFYTVNWTE